MSTTSINTYAIVTALYEPNKYSIEVTHGDAIGGRSFLRTRDGRIRVFTSRGAARKAITRAIRFAGGEAGALHR